VVVLAKLLLAASTTALITHKGHISSFLSSRLVSLSFRDKQPGDRAIPPRTFDIPGPIARLFRAASHPIAFRAPAHSGSSKKSGFFQDAQMFGDGRQRHGVRASEMGHPLIAPGEMGQDPASSGIGQGGESAVEAL